MRPRRPPQHGGRPLFRAASISATCLLLLLVAGRPALAGMEVECGFGGYIKSERWFPVRVKTPPGTAAMDVYLVQTDWCGKNPQPVMRFRGILPADDQQPAKALCLYKEVFMGRPGLRCELRHADGTLEKADLTPDVLSSQDLLVLVVSDQPGDFDFLGSVDRRSGGIVRGIVCAPESFPERWQELDSVSVLILDGPHMPSAPGQREALIHWVVAGGTVILTDRALAAGVGVSVLPLFPELRVLSASGARGGSDLRPLLGGKAAFIESFQGLALDAPAGGRILLSEEGDALVAGRDVGRGRVVACGIDWRDISLKDRAALEMLRQTLWGRLLSFIRPENRWSIERYIVLPREARLSFLMKPLALFMLAYVALIGPVNWLVLRARRRLEYSAVTLPACAVVFAVLAFLIGVSLRSTDPVLHEAEVLFASPGGYGFAAGISGLLSPKRQPYRLELRDDATRLNELEERRPRPPRPGGVLTSFRDAAQGLANVTIDTWSMRFFRRDTPMQLGAGIRATAVCGPDTISGRIENGLPLALSNAFVIAGWDFVEIGDVPPGAAAEFHLKLTMPAGDDPRVCPNCGRIHDGVSGLPEQVWKDNPRLAALRDYLEDAPAGRRPVLVALQGVAEQALAIDQPRLRWNGSRFVMAPVELLFEGPDLFVPEGLALRGERFTQGDALSAADISEIPYRIEVVDLDALEEKEAARRRHGYFGDTSGEEDRVSDFYLPFEARTIEGSVLKVHWDAGKPNPDYPSSECALAIYDWGTTQWVELARASQGDRVLDVAEPDRFIKLPFPVIRLKVAPVGAGTDRRLSVRALDVIYEGRKRHER